MYAVLILVGIGTTYQLLLQLPKLRCTRFRLRNEIVHRTRFLQKQNLCSCQSGTDASVCRGLVLKNNISAK
jgi:hypothetical protein